MTGNTSDWDNQLLEQPTISSDIVQVLADYKYLMDNIDDQDLSMGDSKSDTAFALIQAAYIRPRITMGPVEMIASITGEDDNPD